MHNMFFGISSFDRTNLGERENGMNLFVAAQNINTQRIKPIEELKTCLLFQHRPNSASKPSLGDTVFFSCNILSARILEYYECMGKGVI